MAVETVTHDWEFDRFDDGSQSKYDISPDKLKIANIYVSMLASVASKRLTTSIYWYESLLNFKGTRILYKSNLFKRFGVISISLINYVGSLDDLGLLLGLNEVT